MTPNDTTAPAPDAFQGLVDTARFQRARRIPIADFAYLFASDLEVEPMV